MLRLLFQVKPREILRADILRRKELALEEVAPLFCSEEGIPVSSVLAILKLLKKYAQVPLGKCNPTDLQSTLFKEHYFLGLFYGESRFLESNFDFLMTDIAVKHFPAISNHDLNRLAECKTLGEFVRIAIQCGLDRALG